MTQITFSWPIEPQLTPLGSNILSSKRWQVFDLFGLQQYSRNNILDVYILWTNIIEK